MIVNTCGFITSAKEESIRTALELKSRFPGKKVLLAGCLVARYGEELTRALGELDGFVGLRDPAGLERLLRPASRRVRRRRRSRPGPQARPAGGPAPAVLPGQRLPQGRGGLRQPLQLLRHPADPRAAGQPPARRGGAGGPELLAAGVRELVLIAQDLASFGTDRRGGRAGAAGPAAGAARAAR